MISIHTLLRRVTLHWFGFSIVGWRFQSTLSCGEWHEKTKNADADIVFQSTLSCGEWHSERIPTAQPYIFQSTLSCGEWRKAVTWVWKERGISIHTLLRRVTEINGFTADINELFQSTLSCGEWPSKYQQGGDLPPISIHTLLRRVTPCRKSSRLSGLFQSTLSCGEWHQLFVGYLPGQRYFNPHSPAESDNKGNYITATNIISIHTLLRRVTLSLFIFSINSVISIHTLLRRVTRKVRKTLT